MTHPIHAAIDCLPPVGEWVFVYLGDHDQEWIVGRRESAGVWELDTRREGIPSHVEVDRELVTHWMVRFPAPCEVLEGAKFSVDVTADATPSASETPAPALPR